MKVLLIPDKFKDALSAREVINAIKSGLKRIDSKIETEEILASDGGDGFLDSISNYQASDRIEVKAIDPLGRPIDSFYLFNKNNKTAYIELANTCGLMLLKKKERSPIETTTWGTGIQIKHALGNGAKHVYIGLGGSATNDAGMGIAQALGYRFFDSHNNSLVPIGKNLKSVNRIDDRHIDRKIKTTKFIAVNDVNNPLFGKKGAAHVYAQQKGASVSEIKKLDAGLKQIAKVIRGEYGKDKAKEPGSGAAGGTAYGLNIFCNAAFISGIDFIFELANVKALIKSQDFDYIITGEGKIDDQTKHGKLVAGVAQLGKKYKIPVIAVCGKMNLKKETKASIGLSRIIEVREKSKPLNYNLQNSAKLIEENIFRNF